MWSWDEIISTSLCWDINFLLLLLLPSRKTNRILKKLKQLQLQAFQVHQFLLQLSLQDKKKMRFDKSLTMLNAYWKNHYTALFVLNTLVSLRIFLFLTTNNYSKGKLTIVNLLWAFEMDSIHLFISEALLGRVFTVSLSVIWHRYGNLGLAMCSWDKIISTSLQHTISHYIPLWRKCYYKRKRVL